MACRTALRSALLIEAWQPVHFTRSSVSASFRARSGFSSPRLTRQFRTRDFHLAKRAHHNSSHNENTPALNEDEQGPPQEAVLKAISGFVLTLLCFFVSWKFCFNSLLKLDIEVSRTEGRVGQTTNVVIGGTVADDSTTEWLDLDQKVLKPLFLC